MADWIFKLIDTTGYLGLAFLMWLENIFPPIPSELVMPLAGYKSANGDLHMVGVVIAGTVGSLAGAFMFYGLGRRLGAERIKQFADDHGRWFAVSSDDIDRATEWFERHGGATVFVCRLIPGVRSLISIPAGIAKQNLLSFTLFTTAGTALWCLILAYCGYFLQSNFSQVGEFLNPVSWVVVAVLVVWYVYRVVRHSN